MKLAVIGPKGGVLNVIDTVAKTTTVASATVVEITPAQAAEVAVIRAAKKQPYIVDGVIQDALAPVTP